MKLKSLIITIVAFAVILASAVILYPKLTKSYEENRNPNQNTTVQTTNNNQNTNNSPSTDNSDITTNSPTQNTPVTNSPEVDTPITKPSVTEENPIVTPPAVNQTADFSFTDANGNKVKLSDYFGKPIVVNFFATWCGPCKDELPYFDKASKEFEGEVTFLMINLNDMYDPESTVKNFVNKNGYTFPLYFDKYQEGADTYGIYSIPVTLFINADGSLYLQKPGGMSEGMLYNYISQINK